MEKLKKGIKGLWHYCMGHLFAFFFYDKKYLTGRWFEGKLGGFCSIGWFWVVKDATARIILRDNIEARFPVAHGCRVICPENIDFHPDDLNNFQSYGIYFQALGAIEIGKGTYVGPNVGLITSNHDITNPDDHQTPKAIVIGESCWIGMNSIVLPGVILGPHTTVGAGSVVTHSFPEGNCVVAGNPANIIKRISEDAGK